MTTRGVWVQDPKTGDLIPKHLYRRAPVARSELPSPMLIRDELDYVMNMADGQRYTSKRAYEKAVRRAGCEIIGNEQPTVAPRAELPDPVTDIKAAMEQVQSRTPTNRRKRGKKA